MSIVETTFALHNLQRNNKRMFSTTPELQHIYHAYDLNILINIP